jgi:uncharacterized protein YcaQ
MTDALSLREARTLALRAQAIGASRSTAGPTALRRLLQQQAVVQLDSVNAVARTHELVPYSRLGRYSTPDLYQVVYRQRTMFEYWAHAMSWIDLRDFRYFLWRMERFRDEPRSWWREVREHHAKLYPRVLERVRTEGPLASSDFEDPRGDRGSWWDLKPAKLVLEDLFDQGILLVAGRRSGFQRVYDLAERVLPADLDLRRPTDDETHRHLVLRAAQALGPATVRDLADFYRLRAEQARTAVASLLEDSNLVKVTVEGWREPAYVPSEQLETGPRRHRHRPLLISPFDPLVWERSRAQRLFGFDYRIEIYTPEPKRRYGYYVLPLLVDGALVGRVDARNQRAARTLQVPAVHLEPGQKLNLAPCVAAALWDLARFLEADQVKVGRTDPPELLEPLETALRECNLISQPQPPEG